MNTITKRIFGGLTAVVILALALAVFVPTESVLAASSTGRGGPGGGTGGGAVGTAVTPLTQAEKDGLQAAILEEYKAYNIYQAAIQQLGAQYPFSTISRSELQHVSALSKLAVKYGVTVPANPGLSPSLSFGTLQAACQMGVFAETEDAQLYDQLKAVTTHTDLIQVYNNLQSASLKSHLPAFQTCD